MTAELSVIAIIIGLCILAILIAGIIDILRGIKALAQLLIQLFGKVPSGIEITQIQGDSPMGQILGIAPGTTGQFKETLIPAGAVLPAGTVPQWSVDDTTNTSLTPSADGTSVAIAAGATIQNGATAFNLTVTATFTAPGAASPTTLTKTVSVPFNFPLPTDIDITQVS